MLDDLGLIEAIEWQSKEFEKRSGIKISFESAIPHLPIANSVATSLFRIYQEALTNIARHSNATQVDAVLSKNDNRFVLEIRDNGKGFRMEDMADQKSLGLKGMHERALMVDGEFKIESNPGQGTYIQISIPILITNQEINQL